MILCGKVRRDSSRRRRLVDALARIPKVSPVVGSRSRKIGTRFVDHRQLEPFGLGLLGACYCDVHTIEPAICVRIELGLNPQVVSNPILLVFEAIDNLRFTIFEYWERVLERVILG